MSFNVASASLRDSKRIITLMIGVILAVSIITGIDIGIEEVSGTVLTSFINRLPYDVTAEQRSNYYAYTNISQALGLTEGVYRVDPLFEWNPISLFNRTQAFFAVSSKSTSLTWRNASVATLGVDDTFAQRYNITFSAGSWDIKNGIVLSKASANLLGVMPGDALNLTVFYPAHVNASIQAVTPLASPLNSSTVTLRVAGLGILSRTSENMIEPEGTEDVAFQAAGNLQTHPIFFSYNSLLAAYNSFAIRTGASRLPPLRVLHRVFVRRDKITELFEPSAMLRDVSLIESQLRFYALPYDLRFQDHVGQAILAYQSWLTTNLVSFYLFSLPVLAVSWYATMTSWFLMSEKRRRVFGLMKLRGMSASAIFRSAMLEAGAIGIIAGFLGILAGLLTGNIVANMLNENLRFSVNLQAVTPEIIAIAYAVGISVSLLGAARPALSVAHHSPIESGKEYLEGEAQDFRARRLALTWLLLALAIYKMLEWLLGFSPNTLFSSGSPSSNFFITVLFEGWQFVSGALTILAPFLFVYALARILTRSRMGVYRSVHFILRTFLRELAEITARRLSRNPARIARATFLIALAISFGVFTIVATSTSSDLQTRVAQLSVGGDVNVKTVSLPFALTPLQNPSTAGVINETFETRLRTLKGIAGVTTILEGFATSTVNYGSQYIIVYGVENATLLNVAYASEDFTPGEPAVALQRMTGARNGTLISQGLAAAFRLKTGDGFQLNQTNPKSTQLTTLSVVGTYNLLPGIDSLLGETTLHRNYPTPVAGSLVVDMSILKAINLTNIAGFTFLVRSKPGTDMQRLASSIQTLASPETLNIITLQYALKTLGTNPSALAALTFLKLTSAYLIIAAIVGSTLTVLASTETRLREITLYRARGAHTSQTMKLLSAEFLPILIISLVAGVPAGLMEAYAVLKFFTSPESPTFFANLKFSLVIPPELGILTLVAVTSFLLSGLFASWLAMRKTVIRNLRFR